MGLFAEVGVVAGFPVGADGGEDVLAVGVFEGFGGVREVAGDDEHVAGVEGDGLGGAVGVEDEPERAGDDGAELLVGMGVRGNQRAMFELQVGDGALGTGDELAFEERVQVFGGEGGPVDDAG